MKWVELSINLDHEISEAVTHILYENGISGVSIIDSNELIKERVDIFGEIYALDKEDFPPQGVTLKAYIAEITFSDALYTQIKQQVANLSTYGLNSTTVDFSICVVKEEDWANSWKQYFRPTKITDSLVVVPTWTNYSASSVNEKLIFLDPGMAFGSGTHETTRMCIILLEKYLKSNMKVIDIGTGSGILAIAAALLEAQSVHAVDIDKVAITVARDNIKLNNVAQKVAVYENNLLHNITQKFHILIANIVADVVMSVIKDADKILEADGLIILSGIIEDRHVEVINELRENNFSIIEIKKENTWVAIVAKKGAKAVRLNPERQQGVKTMCLNPERLEKTSAENFSFLARF